MDSAASAEKKPDLAEVLQGPASLRVDKWLFYARLSKSRSLAAKLVSGGNVRINGQKAEQASRNVTIGDMLTMTKDRRVVVVEVRYCGTRRGPAPEAQLLYVDHSPPPRERTRNPLDRLPVGREAGAGRPTKKERRLTDRLLGRDEL